jgi:hypothetical protein
VEGQALDEGIVRTLWLTADEIRASTEHHRSPLLLKCMEDYLAGRRFPLALITTDPSVFLANPKPESPRLQVKKISASSPDGRPWQSVQLPHGSV